MSQIRYATKRLAVSSDTLDNFECGKLDQRSTFNYWRVKSTEKSLHSGETPVAMVRLEEIDLACLIMSMLKHNITWRKLVESRNEVGGGETRRLQAEVCVYECRMRGRIMIFWASGSGSGNVPSVTRLVRMWSRVQMASIWTSQRATADN